jgi:hypothetical protein
VAVVEVVEQVAQETLLTQLPIKEQTAAMVELLEPLVVAVEVVLHRRGQMEQLMVQKPVVMVALVPLLQLLAQV